MIFAELLDKVLCREAILQRVLVRFILKARVVQLG